VNGPWINVVMLPLGWVIRKRGDGSDGGYGVASNAPHGTEEHRPIVVTRRAVSTARQCHHPWRHILLTSASQPLSTPNEATFHPHEFMHRPIKPTECPDGEASDISIGDLHPNAAKGFSSPASFLTDGASALW
jgi:hypothetical protein